MEKQISKYNSTGSENVEYNRMEIYIKSCAIKQM